MAEQKVIHFSDGKKIICGTKTANATAITDAQKVTCKKCQSVLALQAEGKGDPLVWCKVKNMDIPDGVDFAFSFRAPGDKGKLKTYHLINNAKVQLPKTVIDHLKSLAYPFKRFTPGQESGQAMKVAGSYERFVVSVL